MTPDIFLTCYPSKFTVNEARFPATDGGVSDKGLMIPCQCFRNPWLSDRNNLSSVQERAFRKDLLFWLLCASADLCQMGNRSCVKSSPCNDQTKFSWRGLWLNLQKEWHRPCFAIFVLTFWSFTTLMAWSCLLELPPLFLFSKKKNSIFFTPERIIKK